MRHWRLGPLEGRRRKVDEKVAGVQRPCDGQTFQCAIFRALFLLAQGLSSNMKLLRAPAAERLVTRRQPLRQEDSRSYSSSDRLTFTPAWTHTTNDCPGNSCFTDRANAFFDHEDLLRTRQCHKTRNRPGSKRRTRYRLHKRPYTNCPSL